MTLLPAISVACGGGGGGSFCQESGVHVPLFFALCAFHSHSVCLFSHHSGQTHPCRACSPHSATLSGLRLAYGRQRWWMVALILIYRLRPLSVCAERQECARLFHTGGILSHVLLEYWPRA